MSRESSDTATRGRDRDGGEPPARRPGGSGRRLLAKLTRPRFLILAATAITIVYLAVVPLGLLVYETATDQSGNLSFENIRAVVQDPTIVPLLRTTLLFALGATCIAMLIGTPLAYLHARTDISFKSALFAASLLPIVIPGLLFALSWVLLASPRAGLLNMMLEEAFGVRPFNVYTIWGMIWIEGTNLSPVVFLLMLAGFRSMDPSHEEAATMSGARSWSVLWRVTFPLVKPAFLAAFLLTIVRAVDSFDIPALVGIPGNIWVFTSRIWREMSALPVNLGRVGAFATVLLLIAAIGVILHNWAARRGGTERVQTIGGKAFRARPRPIRGKARLAANLFILGYVLAVLVLPVAALLYSSFMPYNMAPSAEAFDQMSLANYRFVLDQPQVTRGAVNSLILAISSASIVMLVAAIASWIVVRTKTPGRNVLDNLAFLPIVYPGVVLGVALLMVYLRVPLPIYGTLLILLFAYMTKYLPYGMRYASTSMYQIHKEVEEAGQMSGASWWQSFRRIILPLIAPGLIAGWIYIAMISMRELSASILIYSAGTEVLAISMFRLYFEGRTNELAALGILLMIGLMVIATIAYRIGSRFGVREDDAVKS